MPQNRWYDDDCKDLHRELKVSQLNGTITPIQVRKEMCTMTRRKRQSWEASQNWELYHMLMSNDFTSAWKRLWEP